MSVYTSSIIQIMIVSCCESITISNNHIQIYSKSETNCKFLCTMHFCMFLLDSCIIHKPLIYEFQIVVERVMNAKSGIWIFCCCIYNVIDNIKYYRGIWCGILSLCREIGENMNVPCLSFYWLASNRSNFSHRWQFRAMPTEINGCICGIKRDVWGTSATNYLYLLT